MNEPQDISREVRETKFLIHDLRVERFINEVIHFHVTVNTDLEIYDVDQAKALHTGDLVELKAKAVGQRKAFHDYCAAVENRAPEESILATGKNYIDTIFDISELILNPRWGRSDQILTFLPPESRSAQQRHHYMNCIRWICGVHSRIRHFIDEMNHEDLTENFDISQELQDFVRNVVYGYVTEKSSARVQIQLDRLDPAVVRGNRYRFRRMFFNLVMNAVDAMSQRRVGVLHVTDVIEGDQVVLRVQDNGSGISPEKIQQLLTERKSLDGELHSLGFVFVRQTVAEFEGDLTIDSEVDKGTTVSVALPRRIGVEAAPRRPVECEKLELLRELDDVRLQGRTAYAKKLGAAQERHTTCGEMVHADYLMSEAQPPGAIFAIGVTDEDRVDFFIHRPYERDWNITHEDLSPMLFEATVRGRLEEGDDKKPTLILKAPQNPREYFEFRELPEKERETASYVDMVHDEYIRVARKLIATGLSPELEVSLTELEKFFPDQEEMTDSEPFPLMVLAGRRLTTEAKGRGDTP